MDRGADGRGGRRRQLLLLLLLHVVHGGLLLHALPPLLLLRLLPHELHAQPDARRHGSRWRWLPGDGGQVCEARIPFKAPGLREGTRKRGIAPIVQEQTLRPREEKGFAQGH